MEERPLVSYKNVDINQQELGVLYDVNFELHKGEFVYLTGKVGSGKSTFLKTIYGELDVCKGEAWVLGYNMREIKRRDIAPLRRKLGIVFQDFQLLTDRTVYDNLAFVLKATGWKDKAALRARIDEVLWQVGMENKGYKMPNELSGGEQQRIVIADVETGRRIVELLRDICSQGSAIIMTTHNLNLLAEYPGKVFRCDNHRMMEADSAETD